MASTLGIALYPGSVSREPLARPPMNSAQRESYTLSVRISAWKIWRAEQVSGKSVVEAEADSPAPCDNLIDSLVPRG